MISISDHLLEAFKVLLTSTSSQEIKKVEEFFSEVFLLLNLKFLFLNFFQKEKEPYFSLNLLKLMLTEDVK